MKKEYKDYLNKNHSFDKLTMISIIFLISVFAGVFGFVYEVIFYYFNEGVNTFFWRGGNFLPWINIYAIGAVIIYFFTYNKRKSPLKVFFISLISCGILEFISGLGIYVLFDGLRFWDYNTEILNFGNIYGFVCLRSVLVFGLSSLLLMYIIVPFIFKLAKANRKIFIKVSIILFTIIMIDEIYNLLITKIFDLPRASYFYRKIGIKYMSIK